MKYNIFMGYSPEAHPAGERNYKLAPSLPEKAVGFTICSDARRVKTEPRGVYRHTLSDDVCSATQQMNVL
ncbi:MAG: hypothetical protein ACLPSL_07025 [Smithella sp.]